MNSQGEANEETISPPDTPAAASPHIVQAPSVCPFSGVAIDPAMWESFQAKLASNSHHNRLQSSANEQKTEKDYHHMVREAEEEEDDGDDQSYASSIASLRSSRTPPTRPVLRRSSTNNYRLRVVNQSTKRSKHILVNRNGNNNLFNAIYNHPSLKEARIHQWGSETTQQIQSGQSEVKIKVVAGEDNSFCRWFTVDEFKDTTTKQLYQIIEEYQTLHEIVIYLVCVSKGSAPESMEESTMEMAVRGGKPSPAEEPMALPSLIGSSTGCNFRIRVVNQTTKRSKDMVLDKNGSESLFNALYDHPIVKAAHIRKWGSEIAKQVKSGQCEIKVKIVLGEDAFCQWFTVEELKETTIMQLHQMTEEKQSIDSLLFYLVCVPSSTALKENQEMPDKSVAATEAILTEKDQSFESAKPAKQEECPVPKRKSPTEAGEASEPTNAFKQEPLAPASLMRSSTASNFRIQVVNQITNRSKDMVLDKTSEESLFNAIYNNRSVKAAHIRKWDSEIAKQVKSGQSEIKVKVVVGEDAFCQWFTVDELKETSTLQLYQMTEEKQCMGPLVFNLVCVTKEAKFPPDSSVEATLVQRCEISESAKAPKQEETTGSKRISLTEEEGESSETASAPKQEPLTPASLLGSSMSSNFQIKVVNQTTKRSKDLVLDKTSEESLFNAIYNHAHVKEAHIRKWGSEIAKQVKSGQSEIKVKVVVGEDAFCQWFTVDELKETTTMHLHQLTEGKQCTSSLVFYLICVQIDMASEERQEKANKNDATAEPFPTESSESAKLPEQGEGTHTKKMFPMEEQDEASETVSAPMQKPVAPASLLDTSMSSNFRIRVVNQTTKRSKDMVLEKDGNDSLFNAIYNHPSVKAAHIRKWDSEVAKQVKSGQCEIKVKIVLGEDAFCQWFTVEELKETTIMQLHQLTEEKQSMGSLVFYLVCVPIDSVESQANDPVAVKEAFPVENGQPSEPVSSPNQEEGPGAKRRTAPQEGDESSNPAISPKQEPSAPASLMHSFPSSNFRIRVVNQTTKHSKDMVLDKTSEESLFNAIYNNPSVKAAHIRKWDSEVVKQVKCGQSEIKVKVVVGEDAFCQWFTVDELKETTAMQLNQLTEEKLCMGSLVFHLVCVPIDSAESQADEAVAAKEAVSVENCQPSEPAPPPNQEEGPGAKRKTTPQEGDESSEPSISPKQEPPVPASLMRSSTASNFRIQVVNQTTNRSKDMVLDKDSKESLFNDIYDNRSVKAAHIRKWDSEIAKQVKSGQSEIKVKVVVGEDAFCQWFTVDELKETSTMQLYQMTEEKQCMGPLVFKLVCVPDGQMRADILGSLSEDALEDRTAQEVQNPLVDGGPAKRVASEGIQCSRGTEGPQVNAAVVKEANTKYWSPAERRQSLTLPSVRRRSISGTSEHPSDPMDESIGVNIDALRTLSVATSSNVDSTMSEPTLCMSMTDVDSQSPQHPWPTLAPMQEKAKTTLGVRVINQTTQRHKDLVVHISDTNTVFDMVYDHPGLKSAHVRKWGGPIAKAVKNGTSEIRFSVWDDDTQKPWRVFSIDELKSTTTRQLYELVSESSNLIKIYLQCVSTANDGNSRIPAAIPTVTSNAPVTAANSARTKTDKTPIDETTNEASNKNNSDSAAESVKGSNKAPVEHRAMPLIQVGQKRQASLHIGKSGRPQHSLPRRQASLRLEKHGRPQFSIQTSVPLGMEAEQAQVAKKPSRPNHMKLAAANVPRNGSYPSMQQLMAMNSNGAIKRRVGSHDRLNSLRADPVNIRQRSASHLALAGSYSKASKNSPRTGPRKFRELSLSPHALYRPNNEPSKASTPTNPQKNRERGLPQNTRVGTSEQSLKESPPAEPQMVTEQTVSQSALDGSNKETPRNNLPMEPQKQASREPRRVLKYTLSGSKNEFSKNASWRPSSKAGSHQAQFADKFLSCLNQSAPPAVNPSQPQEQQKERANEPTKKLVSNLKNSMLNREIDNTTMQCYSEATEPCRKQISEAEMSRSLNESRQALPTVASLSRITRRRRSRRESCTIPTLEEHPPDETEASLKLKRKLKLKRIGSDPLSLTSVNSTATETKNSKIKEFMRLLRAKKLPEFQSQRSLEKKSLEMKRRNSDTSIMGFTETSPSIPAVVQLNEASESTLRPSVSALTLHETACASQRRKSLTSISSSNASSTQAPKNPKDKINRFLRLDRSQQTKNKNKAKTNDKIARFLALQKSAVPENEKASSTRRNSRSGSDDTDHSVSLSTQKSVQSHYDFSRSSALMDLPPLQEISVIANDDLEPPPPVTNPGVALSPKLVNEVFPYHVVVDVDFRIIQVGNNLEMLIQESGLVGRFVSDIMTVTSPIPMFGSWDWNILEKMKDKTIFLESVLSPAMDERVKIKGTLIEVSKSPKQVMLALFPNVKNLEELEEVNLSMADLPLHSCQREAVLLGEHSKSEVNLTNHLDKLHRDLIDSMEQQIKDRTEELAAANRQLESANSRLAIQSARQLEHFACMSHEIRTPLNCIVGMSSLLLDDAEEMDPMHSDSIRMINTSGDLLMAVVNDVLDYAKLESGSFEVDIKESNLQHTLNSVCHSISQKVKDKNVRLRTDYSPYLPQMVETDSRRLQQVLFNLLGNAGKFSKRNSVVDLTVSVVPVASTDVDPYETSNGEAIRFAVKDYGKGIEEKDFKTIFEPFSQASKETQNVYGGTGLGLSITSKLVHRLGGTVSLKSEFGKYTEFTVDLPLRGQEVNVPKLQKKFRNTTLVLVEPPQTYDFSFTEYTIKPEPIPFQATVAEAYKLNVMRCDSVDDVFDRLQRENAVAPGKHFALLVHEDLYQFRLFERLDKLVCRLNYTLMTFGPMYNVEMTKDRHFKSLSGVFPSAMLEKIAKTMERRKVEKMFSNRNLSILVSHEAAEEMRQKIAEGNTPNGSVEEDHSSTPNLFASLGGNGTEAQVATAPASSLFAGIQTTASNTNRPVGGLFAALNDPQQGALKGEGVAPDRNHAGGVEGASKPGGLFSIVTKNDPVPRAALPLNESTAQPMLQPTSAPQSNTSIKAAGKQRFSAARQALKVLYAEDNKINQKVLTRTLSRAGIINLTIVDNGKEAVDITESQQFDIIFMDVQMPVMGGIEATKLIMERNPSEKIVFVTAHALDEFEAQAGAVGATRFISKPFRLDDIEKLLKDLGHPNVPLNDKPNSQSATIDNAQAGISGGVTTTGGLFSIKKDFPTNPVPTTSSGGLFSIKKDSLTSPAPQKETTPQLPQPAIALHSNPRKKAAVKSQNHSSARKALKVLYAEDNKINQKVLTRVLMRSGITDLTVVDNGQKAVDVTKTQEFDIIFMDLEMPIMGGLEATKLIIERKPTEKVIFVSAHALDEFKAKAVAVGALSFISKPVRPADIEKVLEDLGYSNGPPNDNPKGQSVAVAKEQGRVGTTTGGLFAMENKNDAPTGELPSKEAAVQPIPHPSTAPQSKLTKAATTKQENHSSARKALKVLYAEDNKVNQKVFSRVLTRSGVTDLTIVDNGQKAVDITKTQKFDIIFMDIQMPVMGGMEATQLIIEHNPSEKVIFVTAHALDEFKVQAKAAGATSFISKPFRLDDIESLLKELGY